MSSLASPTPGALALTAFAALGAYALARALGLLAPRAPYADLPGPPRASMLTGHMGTLFVAGAHTDGDGPLPGWIDSYGRVLRFHGLLSRPHIATTDLRALAHVAAHSDDFIKWPMPMRSLARTLGGGVLLVEGAEHRRQRRLLNPAFGPAQVRDLSGVFVGKANELCEVWEKEVDGGAGVVRLNALDGLARATLDIMGLAGFGYAFNALSRPAGSRSALASAFDVVFQTVQFSVEALIGMVFPAFDHVPTARNRRIKDARQTMDGIGLQLLQERQAAVAAGERGAEGRDLLSLLVRANESEAEAKRLSDAEMLAQIPTFLLAGHETSSTTLSWILLELAQHPELQARLRAEARSLPLSSSTSTDTPLDADTLSALEKLPLLDGVLRETLRVHPPVLANLRMATRDTTVPLSAPVTDRKGVAHSALQLREGDMVLTPIFLINRLKEVYGADADVWNPDRWASDAKADAQAGTVPGIWGNMLTFWAGPHACIGWRFAVLETKILLHALVSRFAFELAVPASEMSAHTEVVTRPLWTKESEKGPQVPLFIRRAE